MVSTKKKKKYEKEEEEKIRNIKTKSKASKYINKFRRKREEIDKNIKMTMEGSLCRIIERNGKENDKRKRRRKRVGGRK